MRTVEAIDLLERLYTGTEDTGPAPAAAVIVAHPDDEVIGVGGRLPRLRGATFIHVTDGAPRNLHDARAAGFATCTAYAHARRAEFQAALALARIPIDRACCLGFADQEASLHLAELVQILTAMLAEQRPELVLTHPYEGGHPDHDATAFAVRTACRLLPARGVAPPAVVEMTSYHRGPDGMRVAEFLPGDGGVVSTLVLAEEERRFKRRLFDCYRTQLPVLAAFPIAYERFRAAPRYDFRRPPHSGTLYYEGFDWGMTGERWRRLAAEALGTLEV